jgi:hypothetical protein
VDEALRWFARYGDGHAPWAEVVAAFDAMTPAARAVAVYLMEGVAADMDAADMDEE